MTLLLLGQVSRQVEGTEIGKEVALNKSRVIVSFTTYPRRVAAAAVVAEGLLESQTRKPDLLILNLSEEEFLHRSVPPVLARLVARGLTINWVHENLRPHNKWFETLGTYPDDLVIVLDDDIAYPPTLIEDLLATHETYPDAIIANRAHLVRFDESGDLLPYARWAIDIGEKSPSIALFGTGVGGMLLQARLFDDEIRNVERIKEHALTADDCWLWVMAIRCGVPTAVARRFDLKFLDDTQESGLWRNENQLGAANDTVIHDLLQDYGISPTASGIGATEDDVLPRISVIMRTGGAERSIAAAIDDIARQRMASFECIIVDDRPRDSTASCVLDKVQDDARFSLVRGENQGDRPPQNIALDRAVGRYVLFLNANDRFDKNLLRRLYRLSEQCDTDVMVCGYRELCDSDISMSMGENVQKALLGRLPPGVFGANDIDFVLNFVELTVWNKMFKRSFLNDNELRSDANFGGPADLSFVGSALCVAHRILYVKDALAPYRGESAPGNVWPDTDCPLAFVDRLDQLEETLLSRGLMAQHRRSFDNLLAELCVDYLERSERDAGILTAAFGAISARFERHGFGSASRDYFFSSDRYDVIVAVASQDVVRYLLARVAWSQAYIKALILAENAAEEHRSADAKYYAGELERARTEVAERAQSEAALRRRASEPGIRDSGRALWMALSRRLRADVRKSRRPSEA